MNYRAVMKVPCKWISERLTARVFCRPPCGAQPNPTALIDMLYCNCIDLASELSTGSKSL